MSFSPFDENQNLPFTESPYYSRLFSEYFSSNTTLLRNYVGVAFKPGYALQASELNEIQEMMYVHSTLTTTMISNWINSNTMNPPEGIQVNGPGWDGATPLSPDLITRNNNQITANPGWYLVREPNTNLKHWVYIPLIPPLNIPADTTGTVGFNVTTLKVGPNSDPNLYDNSSGDSDFNAEGADRYIVAVLGWSATFSEGTINGGEAQSTDEFAPLFTVDSSNTYRFMNGLLF